MFRRTLLASACCLLLCLPVAAMFMRIDEPVPVDRLLANLQRHLEQNPDSAVAHYTLGRVHSLAYAKRAWQVENPGVVEVVPAEKRQAQPGEQAPELPGFATYQSVRVGAHAQGPPPKVSPEARRHLEASLKHYGRAVELEEKNALYRLGFAWMLEQAALYTQAGQGAADEAAALPPGEERWEQQALEQYRHTFALRFDADAARQHYLKAGDELVSQEAGEGAIRMLERLGPDPEGRREIQRLRGAIEKLEQIPAAITPIVFSLDPVRHWKTFIDHNARSRFDLSGDGAGRQWPWVRGDVGMLVWDPERTGRIESGRQLFGSVTWWMFWENGYEALAALDDDGDGWLRGPELDGIAAWFDHNGDGASGAGEVVSLAELGIVGIRVRGESHDAPDVAAWQPGGLVLADGSSVATYDWRPTSLPSNPEAAAEAEPALVASGD